ncbi:MAG: sporulation integral membrane protein YtvI [Clostridiales bacterium]|mgnify:CR=1 FL=1|nr:sporulation integral membrane protein YtvI [Clostridiales bacterium]
MEESKLLTYIKILLNLIFIILAALFLLFVLPKILRFFIPFVIGWIVSMIANPLVRFLENKVKLLRKHSSAIIIVIVIAAIVGALYALITFIFKETSQLIAELPEIVEQVEQQLNELSHKFNDIADTLPENFQVAINNLILNVGNSINKFISELDPSLGSAGAFAQGVAEGFLIVIVTILSAYFFTVDRDKLLTSLKKNLPDSITNGWSVISDNFKTAFGGYFKAQFKIMLVLIVIMFIGFEILNVGYSFLIALGIAFLDFLPVFGTGAILWPWALFDMITGNYVRAVGLIVIYLICQVLKQILQPKMVGDSIGISPLSTLVFMYIGYRLYKVLGMIIGIPIGMVIVNLYRIGMFDSIIRGFKIIIHDINEFRKF